MLTGAEAARMTTWVATAGRKPMVNAATACHRRMFPSPAGVQLDTAYHDPHEQPPFPGHHADGHQTVSRSWY